jgi:hypothetical protein
LQGGGVHLDDATRHGDFRRGKPELALEDGGGVAGDEGVVGRLGRCRSGYSGESQ